ncbi:hypothetical protein FACS1894219_09260 [Clostridia bacterium]|nr:hypothetical protein FACS1894219_09260 [Clostridia bacterium]
MKTKIKKPVLTIITVCLLCALVVLTFLSRTILAANQTEVMYAGPERTDIITYRDITGVVEFENTYEAVYDIPLTVTGVYVKSGDSVTADKILVEVDSRELALELKKKEFTVTQIKNKIADTGITEELKTELEIAEEEAALYREKYPTDGKIRAKSAGTVYSVNAAKGETILPGVSLAAVSTQNSSANVIFYLSESDAKFFSGSDSAILYYSEIIENTSEVTQSREVVKNSAVLSKEFILKDNLFKFSVPVETENDSVYHGQQIQVKITNMSPVYDMVIPYEAVHKNSGDTAFVYILKKRDGLFGDEYYPEMVNVNLLYENGVNAAVYSTNITQNDGVVTYASGLLTPGETVRILN